MIRLNVFILVTKQNKQSVINAAKELVYHTLNEKGCKAYDLFESSTREDVLMICETWDNQESLDIHQKTHHYKVFKEAIKNLCTIKIEKFDFISEVDSIH